MYDANARQFYLAISNAQPNLETKKCFVEQNGLHGGPKIGRTNSGCDVILYGALDAIKIHFQQRP